MDRKLPVDRSDKATFEPTAPQAEPWKLWSRLGRAAAIPVSTAARWLREERFLQKERTKRMNLERESKPAAKSEAKAAVAWKNESSGCGESIRKWRYPPGWKMATCCAGWNNRGGWIWQGNLRITCRAMIFFENCCKRKTLPIGGLICRIEITERWCCNVTNLNRRLRKGRSEVNR